MALINTSKTLVMDSNQLIKYVCTLSCNVCTATNIQTRHCTQPLKNHLCTLSCNVCTATNIADMTLHTPCSCKDWLRGSRCVTRWDRFSSSYLFRASHGCFPFRKSFTKLGVATIETIGTIGTIETIFFLHTFVSCLSWMPPLK
jgi:hypothetical protein